MGAGIKLSCLLGIRTDYLLGIESRKAENGEGVLETWIEIGNYLRNSLEPLELIFGKELACEGILLPVLRIRDEPDLGTGELHCVSSEGDREN